MIRNNSSRIHIFCILVVTTLCAGCASNYRNSYSNAENYVDLSDPAAGKAQLRATNWSIGFSRVYCFMTDPAYAERVTLNAGTVDVSVVCVTQDVGLDGEWKDKASFSFDALAGHDYVITKRRCGGCVKLTDETTGEVVAEFPVFSSSNPAGFKQDLSTGDDTATIRGYSCRFSNGDVSSLFDVTYLVVDAGPINFDAICETGTFRQQLRISSFNFVAEAGHTYIILKVPYPFGVKCIGVYDQGVSRTPIACEPYEEVD